MPNPRNHSIKKYGWVPDLPDHRDFLFSAPQAVLGAKLPKSIDLRAKCPPVYDQGQLGSCTGNAIAGAFQFEQMKQGVPNWIPSRLFIYYNERVIEGSVSSDNGAQIRDGVKSVATTGVCPETDWPYDITKFADKPPDPPCYVNAAKNIATSYQRVAQVANQMKGCLAAGYPFVFGFSVYQSFETPQVAQTGRVPMPAPGEKLLGGHAVLAVGYDDAHHSFIARNSWGTGWGMAGYFTIPYSYLTDSTLASDFWTIRLVA